MSGPEAKGNSEFNPGVPLLEQCVEIAWEEGRQRRTMAESIAQSPLTPDAEFIDE